MQFASVDLFDFNQSTFKYSVASSRFQRGTFSLLWKFGGLDRIACETEIEILKHLSTDNLDCLNDFFSRLNSKFVHIKIAEWMGPTSDVNAMDGMAF